jgi:hypothetical protein
MITLFATPKPFEGHFGIIQRNALRSWVQLHPDVEVILFGDDKGARETASEVGVKHGGEVPRNAAGRKHLNWVFDRAQDLARHDLVCYVNCDIILTRKFLDAVQRVAPLKQPFLLVSRRWNVAQGESLDISEPDWEKALVERVLREGTLFDPSGIDVFVFRKGILRGRMPPFVTGVFWDNWIIYHFRSRRMAVIDATAVAMPIHQDHDYSHRPDGKSGMWEGAEACENRRLGGGWAHLFTTDDATHRLTEGGLVRADTRSDIERRLNIDEVLHPQSGIMERGRRRCLRLFTRYEHHWPKAVFRRAVYWLTA